MSVSLTLIVVLLIAVAAFFVSRARVMSLAGGDIRGLHSLPGYYGWFGFLSVAVPAALMLCVWMIAQPVFVERQLQGYFPAEQMQDASARTLIMEDVRRVAAGLDVAVAVGALGEGDLAALDAETTDVRATLAEVGVALGSDVTAEVLDAARSYRETAHWAALGRSVVVIGLAVLGLMWAVGRVQPDFRARNGWNGWFWRCW